MHGARTRRLTAAALAGTTLAVAMASSATAQPVKPETLMAERSNPAVQLVETTVAASVSMRNIDLTRAGTDLFTVGIAKWYAGELRSASDVVEYAFERVERDPSHYLKETGAHRTTHFSESFRGTGFIATPDGYVVTARHVVTSDKEVKRSFAEQGAAAFAKADVKALLKDFAQYDLSNAAVDHIVSAVSTFEAQKVKAPWPSPRCPSSSGRPPPTDRGSARPTRPRWPTAPRRRSGRTSPSCGCTWTDSCPRWRWPRPPPPRATRSTSTGSRPCRTAPGPPCCSPP